MGGRALFHVGWAGQESTRWHLSSDLEEERVYHMAPGESTS